MAPSFPAWLHLLSIASLMLAGVCAIGLAVAVVRNPPKMRVMALVWPLTALFGSVAWVWLYARARRAEAQGGETPMPLAVAKGSSHCGAGCTLGDICAEWLVVAVPAVAGWLGWPWLFAEKTFAVWVLDFLAALVIGIGFQYWAIQPMRKLPVGEALLAAIKADTLSITSWQVGMYGAMALIQFGLLRPTFGDIAPVASPEFWFVMQIAMLAGFATAFPVNWLLVRGGIKERM